MLDRDPDYRSPLHAVDAVRVRLRGDRRSVDLAPLYAVSAIAGIATGYLVTLIG
jgi:hypothetical protein